MDTIAHLREEHRTIESILDLLEQIYHRIEGTGRFVPAHLGEVLVFVEVFLEQFHMRKEERLLYAAMEHAGESERELITSLLTEHSAGQAMIKQLAAETARCREGAQDGLTRLARQSRELVRLFRQHIEYEDTVLYPLAIRLLTAEQQERLLYLFAEQDRVAVGPERRDEVAARIAEIWRSYAWPEVRPAGGGRA